MYLTGPFPSRARTGLLVMAFACGLPCFPSLPTGMPIPAAHAAGEKAAITRLYIVQQPVAAVLETLGGMSGFAMQIDPGIDKVARQVNLQGTMPQVVSQISRLYNLHYWFDGARYSISLPANLVRKSILVDKISADYVRSTIAAVAPFISDNAIEFNQVANVLNVYGPKELADNIEKLLANYSRETPDSVSIIKYGQTTR